MSKDFIEIDGSILEGGGQILRIALSLSVIKRTPIRVTNIRAGRGKPGLMEQHLKCVELLADLCTAKVKGVTAGSTQIEFWPNKLDGGSFQAKIRTAGSITLLLQAALPCTLFASTVSELRLFGGTNAQMAPQVDFTTEIFRPVLEKFGANFKSNIITRGYFPAGGGQLVITVNPISALKPVKLIERGEISLISGWSFVAGTLPIELSHVMATSAINVLQRHKNIAIDRYKEDRSRGSGNFSGIILVAKTTTGCILGSSAIGKRSETPEETGKRAARELEAALEEGACVDEHVQDQVIIFMALAPSASVIRAGKITLHTETAIFIAEKMTNAKFEIVKDETTNLIKCSGST